MKIAALVLLLTQMCVGEINFPEQPRECEVMWSVMFVRADAKIHKLPITVRQYNSIFKSNTPRAQWVKQISHEAARPSLLSVRLTWDAALRGRAYSRRESVERTLRAAREFLTSNSEPPAYVAVKSRGVRHYGGDCDDDVGACDYTKPCYERVQMDDVCGGDCAQAYWNVDACPLASR